MKKFNIRKATWQNSKEINCIQYDYTSDIIFHSLTDNKFLMSEKDWECSNVYLLYPTTKQSKILISLKEQMLDKQKHAD